VLGTDEVVLADRRADVEGVLGNVSAEHAVGPIDVVVVAVVDGHGKLGVGNQDGLSSACAEDGLRDRDERHDLSSLPLEYVLGVEGAPAARRSYPGGGQRVGKLIERGRPPRDQLIEPDHRRDRERPCCGGGPVADRCGTLGLVEQRAQRRDRARGPFELLFHAHEVSSDQGLTRPQISRIQHPLYALDRHLEIAQPADDLRCPDLIGAVVAGVSSPRIEIPWRGRRTADRGSSRKLPTVAPGRASPTSTGRGRWRRQSAAAGTRDCWQRRQAGGVNGLEQACGPDEQRKGEALASGATRWNTALCGGQPREPTEPDSSATSSLRKQSRSTLDALPRTAGIARLSPSPATDPLCADTREESVRFDHADLTRASCAWPPITCAVM
jgi:hypothetical protein